MSSSSESDDSKSKDKKKVDKKSKKAKKKAKKESKKAKKLAKQIKKLEDEVERRKRQMNGEVQEKKKKKKKDSSSSSSTQSAKKLKKGAREGEDPYPEAVHEDQDQQTAKVVRPCPQCSEEMLWSDLAEGDYSEDWWCDNIHECGASGSKSRTRWRWNCQKCTRDLCRECKGLPEGWIESVEEPAQLSESSSEESNPERHEGTECDHCEMCPIIGPRFKCTSCEDVSLCRTCYKRRLEVHKPGHRFFAMKPMLGMPSDATEKLKERKKLEKQKQEKMEKMEKQKQEEKEMRDQRLHQQTQGIQGHAQPYESQHTMWAMDHKQHQPEMYSNATGFHMAPSFLPIHFAPPVQPTDAPEVASKLQERWQNIGQEYKKSWGPQETAAEPKKTKEKAKDAKEPATVGKQLLRGSKCGLCLQQVLDSASGVVCSRKRPDGSGGGCGKGVCFPCMLRASSMMFGKVRITKEIWVALSDKAWWMHERCMTENDHSDFEDLIQSFGLKAKLDEASAELPQGWTRKISHTTGKVFFVNAKLGQAQWDLPTRDVEASPTAGDQSQEVPDHGVANGNQKVEDMDGNGGKEQAGDQEELVEL